MPRYNKGFQPMLACKAPADLSHVAFPVWGSRKLDGIRCVIRDGVPLSRKLKLIPNLHIRGTLRDLELPDLDGELLLADPTAPFSNVTSAVMSGTGWPDFRYHVFDCLDPSSPLEHSQGNGVPYWRRYNAVQEAVQRVGDPLVVVPHWEISDLAQLQDNEGVVLAEGFEGLMLRSIQGPYKYGRATPREGWLMKLKRFSDAEATVLELIELCRNDNDLEVNEVGYAKRSTAQSGKVPAGTLGALRCLWNDVEFEIGTGFDARTRQDLWDFGDHLLGRAVKFKYQGCGSRGRPRFPVFLGLRDPIDG